MSGDERDERPRRSWSEIDRARDRPRRRDEAPRPRGPAAAARAQAATRQYLAAVERQLFARPGAPASPAGARLAAAVRAAVGTPALDDACRAYLEQVGPPAEPALASAFLDARDRALRLAALRALAGAPPAGAFGAGLRAQLRMLADGLDDELAEAAEAVLERARDRN